MDRRSIWKLVEGILERDGQVALQVVAHAHAAGHEMRQLVDGLAREFRNLTVAASLGSAGEFVDLPEEEVQAIDDLAAQQQNADLQRLFAMALDGADEVARAEESRLAAELLILRMVERPLLAEAATIAQAIARLDALVRGKPTGKGDDGNMTQAVKAELSPQKKKSLTRAETLTPAQAPTPPPPQHSAPRREVGAQQPTPSDSVDPPESEAIEEDDEESDPAFGLSLNGADPAWVQVVDALGAKDRPMAVKLEQARVLREGDTFHLFFKQSLHRKQVQAMLDAPALAQALKNTVGKGSTILVSDDEKADGAAISIVQARQEALDRAEAALSAHAQENPTVRRALALFGGEVRDVRRAKPDRE
jgi:DNA polymerase-3 subunit gamma/tau